MCLVALCLSVQRFLSCRRSNTRRWPDAGLMLARHLHHWANIGPVLGYHVVFGATLNVGQHHRQRPTVTQLCFKASCRYRQHEVLTRAEWILPSIGSVSVLVLATSSKHYQTSYYWTQPSKHEALNQCWFDVAPASLTVGQQWASIVSTSKCSLGVLTSHNVFCTSAWFKNGIINYA